MRIGNRVVGKGFYGYVGEGGGGWEFEEHGQEGVLEVDGLPEFASRLLLGGGDVRSDNVGIAVEAHGVGLS